MISVDAALTALFSLAGQTEIEEVSLRDAAGRVLARPVRATRDQPPFAASSGGGSYA